MSLFHRKISFTKHDPLGDGLGDLIDAERAEGDSITLADEDGQQLAAFWNGVSKNLKKDPDWFEFDND